MSEQQPQLNGSEVNLPRVKLSSSHSTIIDIVPQKQPQLPEEIVRNARISFQKGKTRPLAFRLQQLKELLKFLQENENAICHALYKDLKKCRHETLIGEIAIVVKDIKYMMKNLKKLMEPDRPTKGLLNIFDGLYVYKEPYGVVLIMGAWNYPLHILLSPLVGAIGGGNCAILKPSEIAPTTSNLVATMLPQYLCTDCYYVLEGGVKETTELLKQKFDYIFYTGSSHVGKIVHRAANHHLTPCTLELGGKSPTYIDDSVDDIDTTVRRILWGKLANCGQTCIAPDYVLCTKQVQEKFVQAAERVLKEFFGGGSCKTSPDYGRIVTRKHFDRLNALLTNQKIAIGGNTDPDSLYIHPTILVDVSPNDDIMQEEIFGPILPILNVNDELEAIDFINSRDKPLALYVFTKKKRIMELFIERTSSGGVCINDTLMHATVDDLPFGGVGMSGMGAYHGKASFDTFVHAKSVMKKDFFFIGERVQAIRYPPYSKRNTSLMAKLFKWNPSFTFKHLKYFVVFGLGVGVTLGAFYINKYCNEQDK